MFKDLKYRLTTGWGIWRILRALLAVAFMIAAWQAADWLIMVAGGFLLSQALLNVGCCGIGGCDVPEPRKKADSVDNPVLFEEVKSKEF